MSDGGIPDHGSAAYARGGIAVQVFDRGECRGYQHYRDLLHFLAFVGALFLKKCGEPQVHLGNAGWGGVLCDHLCGVRRGGSRFYADQQCLHHDTSDLSWQRDARRHAGVERSISKNFVKKLSFLSKYVILAKELFVLLIT